MAIDLAQKVQAETLDKIIAKLIDLRQSVGDWNVNTSECYRHALRKFIEWYKVNTDNYDSTRALARDWISRAKGRKDNENNYRVVGNLAIMVADLLQVQDIYNI